MSGQCLKCGEALATQEMKTMDIEIFCISEMKRNHTQQKKCKWGYQFCDHQQNNDGVCIIKVYFPTSNAPEQKSYEVFNQLSVAIDKTRRGNVSIVRTKQRSTWRP